MKDTKHAGLVRKWLAAQPFWVTVAVIIICVVMSWLEPDSFPTRDNFFNITRNFAYIGIMALGMMAVIITGGIDLSVGSVMGLTGIVCGLVLQAGHSWWLAVLAGLATGALCGLVNGAFVAYVGLPSFVVTLGMLAAARSFAVVLSENKMIYDFGPDGDTFNAIGGGEMAGISNMVWLLLVMTLAFGFVFRFTRWGRHVYAVGGNEAAARLAGVAVNRIKLQTYTLCALTVMSGPLTAMRSACGIERDSNRPFSLTPCHWLSLSRVTTFDMAWMRPISSSRATSTSMPCRKVRVMIDWITARMFLTR